MKCNQSRPGFELEFAVSISSDYNHYTNECPGHDTKQSDGEDPVMPELWGMWSTRLCPSLPYLRCPDRVQSIDKIELFHI